MHSFDILDPKTPIFRKVFLEASAGTGKTFAIEHLVPRLLLESRSPALDLSNILVVTFTRAATRELKSRIYQNLLAVQKALDSGVSSLPYVSDLLKQDPSCIQKAQKTLEEALCFFQKAQVFTLHGFCLKILQEFSLESGFMLSFDDEQECTQKQKLKEYLKDVFRRGIDPAILSQAQLKAAFSLAGKNTETLMDLILYQLEGGKKLQPYESASQLHKRWNDAIRALPLISSSELWHDYRIIAPRLASSEKRKKGVELFFSSIEKGSCSFDQWDELLQIGSFFIEDIKFSKAYLNKDPSKRGLLHCGLFERLKEDFVPLYTQALDKHIALLQLASACKAHYDKARADLLHFSPDDLVVYLKQALEKSPSFRRKLIERFKAVIIDEFQDTDLAQWDIFTRLFFSGSASVSALYLVGDPKQSIYAFRRADVYLYLKAAELLGEGSISYLNTNYRSHPALIEALNTFFSFQLPAKWMHLPMRSEGLEVRAVKSKPPYPSFLDGDDRGRMHFFVVEDDEGSGKKWPRESVEYETLFPAMAQEIVRLRKEKGCKFSQMAILVKDRFQAQRLQETFKSEYSIPCLMQKTFSPLESSAYEAMKDLLCAAARPQSLSALKRFLSGPFLGYPSHEVEGGLENLNIQKAKEFFLETEKIFRRQGLGAFVQKALTYRAYRSGKAAVEDLLSRPDPAIYFELRQLVQIVIENAQDGLYDPEVCYQFVESLQEEPDSSEFLKQALEEEEDQVQVMTLHKSKGLEFDIVFALGVCARHGSVQKWIPLRSKDPSLVGVSSMERTEASLYTEELDAEKLRQLYVALTRAKERLYIPIVHSTAPQEIPRGLAAPLELLLGAMGLSSYSFETVYQNLLKSSVKKITDYLESFKEQAQISFEIVTKNREVKVEPCPRAALLSIEEPAFFVSQKNSPILQSFSSMAETRGSMSEMSVAPKANDELLPLGAETGTALHSLLEEICKAGLHQKPLEDRQAALEKSLQSSFLFPYKKATLDLIEKVFQTPLYLCDRPVSLAEIPSKDMKVEMEFLYPKESSYIKGFIDLVFRIDGRYYLLDWKTNYLGPTENDYSQEAMKACMDHHQYFLQASIYTNALEKYLALYDARPFSKIFGGAIYFFLRQTRAYIFQPKPGAFACLNSPQG